jgi:hypothetical protein
MVLVAVSMVALAGMLVFSIDAGELQRQRRMAQTAADAAALAGAVEILRNRGDSITASARSEAARNNFANLVGGDTVTVIYPASSGTFTGSRYVDVVVQRTVPTYFANIFGQRFAIVRGRSTAGIVLSEYCFIVLDPEGNRSLDVQNTARLTGSDCGIAVNSSNNVAAAVTDQGQVTASVIGITGGVEGTRFNPAPDLGVPPVADPLAYLSMPAVPNTCDYVSKVVNHTETLNPGTYCGGLKVLQGHAKLNPGLYILRGGGLEVKGANAEMSSLGSGVTFFNTALPGGGGYEPILLQANVTVHISANTDPSSALPGILFYQDPAAPSNQTNVFKAGSGSVMNGTLYFPTQTVEFGSASTSVVNGAVVAFRVVVQNNTAMTFTGYNGGSEYFALRRPAIVE